MGAWDFMSEVSKGNDVIITLILWLMSDVDGGRTGWSLQEVCVRNLWSSTKEQL